MPKGRKENLIDPNTRTSEELREMTRKGGIKSGEARRRKRTMREALEHLLYHGKIPETTKQMMKAEGIADDEMTHQMVITRSLIAKAEAGDVQAYNAVCAMIGEKPAEKMEMSGNLLNNLTIDFKNIPEGKHLASSEDEVLKRMND
jgi:hypothetical protein